MPADRTQHRVFIDSDAECHRKHRGRSRSRRPAVSKIEMNANDDDDNRRARKYYTEHKRSERLAFKHFRAKHVCRKGTSGAGIICIVTSVIESALFCHD